MPEKPIFITDFSDFTDAIDFADYPVEIDQSLFENLKLSKPVTGTIALTHHNEDILADIEVEVTTKEECERCLDLFENKRQLQFERLLSEHPKKENEETVKIPPDFKIDLGKEIKDEITVQRPYKILCKENCKGLCPICGTNLNLKEKHNCY